VSKPSRSPVNLLNFSQTSDGQPNDLHPTQSQLFLQLVEILKVALEEADRCSLEASSVFVSHLSVSHNDEALRVPNGTAAIPPAEISTIAPSSNSLPLVESASSLPPGLTERLLPRLRCLQAVVARLPQTVVITDLYKTVYYVAKLACGHEFIEYPQAHSITAKRRNCVTCANLRVSLPPKKPAVSAPAKESEKSA
jgi:hypothetical protein